MALDGRAHVVAFRATDKAGNVSATDQVSLDATGVQASAAPQVSGTASYGSVLRATPGVWDADVSTSLQWLRDGGTTADEQNVMSTISFIDQLPTP